MDGNKEEPAAAACSLMVERMAAWPGRRHKRKKNKNINTIVCYTVVAATIDLPRMCFAPAGACNSAATAAAHKPDRKSTFEQSRQLLYNLFLYFHKNMILTTEYLSCRIMKIYDGT